LTDKAGRSTRHIELKVPRSKSSEQSDGALYTAGDHLAIFPENNAAAVKAAANALGVSLDSYFVLTPASLKSSMKPPLWSKAPVSVQKYLTQIPDLSCHPTRQQLEVLSYYAADQAESENLRFLSTTVEDAVQLYATTIVGTQFTQFIIIGHNNWLMLSLKVIA
jgi:sulfite reductase alpha subunit-like flavoprotein